MQCQVSQHGEYRARKRAGLSRRSVDRTCQIVIECGLHLAHARGPVLRWMESHARGRSRGRVRVILYADKAWIFDQAYTLITVYAPPRDIVDLARAQIQKRRTGRRSSQRPRY